MKFIKNIFLKLNFLGKTKPFIFPGLILLLSAWALFYYDNFPLAQSESGLFFYPSFLFEGYKSTWSTFGFGADGALMLPLKTFIFVYFLNHDSNIDPFLVQFSFYFSLFCLSYLGIYLNIKEKYSINKAIFYYLPLIYIYNPFSLFLLERFQYPFIAFYYIVPLIYYFTYKYLTSTDKFAAIKWITLVNLLLLSFSIIYVSFVLIALLMLFWLVMFASFAFFEYRFNIFKYLKFVFIKCIPFLLAWFAVNSYWFFPLLLRMITPVPFSSIYSSTNDNLGNLIYFSETQGGLFPIITMINDNFNFSLNEKYLLYKNAFYVLALIPFVTILGASLSKKYISFKKERYLSVSLLVFIVFFILLRALNFPFGFIFREVFEHITYFQVFRNPFEKFNMIFITPYLIIFSLAFIYLYNRYSKYRSTFTVIFFLYIFLYNFPLWTGHLFLGALPPFSEFNVGYRIQVPDSYKSAANYLEETKTDNTLNRTLVLPLSKEGISYNWPYGYAGAEFIHYFLSDSSIAMISGPQVQTAVANNIKDNLPYMVDKYGYLSMLGFENILIRNDIQWSERGLMEPDFMDRVIKYNYKIDYLNEYHLEDSTEYIAAGAPEQIYSPSDFNKQSLTFDTDGEVPISFYFKNDDFKNKNAYGIFVVKAIDVNNANLKKIVLYGKKKNPKTDLWEDFDDSANLHKDTSVCDACFVSNLFRFNPDKIYMYASMPFGLKEYQPRSQTIESISIAYISPSVSEDDGLISESFGGNLKLYKNQMKPLPLLYSVNKLDFIKSANNITHDPIIDYQNTAYVYNHRDSSSRIKRDQKLLTSTVEYTKISEAEYNFKIKADETSDPTTSKVYLILPYSFDPLWKMYYADADLNNPYVWKHDNIFEKQQYITNTYANGWLIDYSLIKDRELKLVYLPQVVYESSLPFVYTAWGMLFLINIVGYIKRKPK